MDKRQQFNADSQSLIGKKCKVKHPHPHAGETAMAVRVDNTSNVWNGLLMKNLGTGPDYYVFDLKEVEVIE